MMRTERIEAIMIRWDLFFVFLVVVVVVVVVVV